VAHQRTRTKILKDHRSRQIPELLTKDPPKTTSEAELLTMAGAKAEAHTHQDLYTACTTVMKLTLAPKIALFTSTPKRKWIKSWLSLRNN
jgi:hypothetical protein